MLLQLQHLHHHILYNKLLYIMLHYKQPQLLLELH
jgi:hypothetical protein